MLDRLRFRLASVDALPLLVVLGICSGVLAGAVIILFRLLIEQIQAGFLPGGQTENYEALPVGYRLLIPTLGGLFIGLLFQSIAKGARVVGIVHVMERLAYHQGHVPLKNALMQFAGAAVSIISGHSVGREGPSVHLGAASGSLLGQWLTLPNNSLRTLVACGTAAAIAASFNTPIAGVIFAMEVVMMEYTINGFAPVILAAVSATVMSRWVFGEEPAFTVPPLEMASLQELPNILIMGFMMGVMASLFISLLQRFSRWGSHIPIWLRITLAGLVIGVCALGVPEVMGIGYDTVNHALLGQLGLWVLLGILIVKLFATTFGLGFGLPGGLIGPTLVIGAAGGGALGLVVAEVFPGPVASHGFYAMIGMGAMMGATLQAPLAALMAMLELTANPNIILPGMVAVIIAGMTSSHLFRKEPVFVALMKARGLDYRHDPVTQSLHRVGVASVMNRSFISAKRRVSRTVAKDLVTDGPIWVLIEEGNEPKSILLAADLAGYLEATQDDYIDLLEIPAQREDVRSIALQATLHEAQNTMNKEGVDVLYVWRVTAPGIKRIYGVLTRQAIEASYR